MMRAKPALWRQLANIYGFNAGVRVDFSNRWSATGSVNLTEGKDFEAVEPLRHTSSIFGLMSEASIQ
jgi:hypothetical protein